MRSNQHIDLGWSSSRGGLFFQLSRVFSALTSSEWLLGLFRSHMNAVDMRRGRMIDRYGRIAAGDRRLADVLRSVSSQCYYSQHDARCKIVYFHFYFIGG